MECHQWFDPYLLKLRMFVKINLKFAKIKRGRELNYCIYLRAEVAGKHEPMIDYQHETKHPQAIPILSSLRLSLILKRKSELQLLEIG